MEKCNKWRGSFYPRCTLNKHHYGECGDAQRIEQAAASAALQVQDACNLTGVLNSMLGHARRLKDTPAGDSTDKLNRHPAMQLFADKIASLCGVQGSDDPSVVTECVKASERCQQLSKEVS